MYWNFLTNIFYHRKFGLSSLELYINLLYIVLSLTIPTITSKLFYNKHNPSVPKPIWKMWFSRLQFTIDSWNFWWRFSVPLSIQIIVNLFRRTVGHASKDINTYFLDYSHTLFPTLHDNSALSYFVRLSNQNLFT